MLVECKNCHTKVIVSSNGKCPSCRKYANVLESTNPVAEVIIREGSKHPNICCGCGSPTSDVKDISKNRRVGGESLFVRIILGIARPFSFFSSSLKGKHQSVNLSVPFCRNCTRNGSIEIKHVDYEGGYIKIIVHQKFREALLQMQKN